ncbi:F-box DNA helicase 1-like [Amphiura filiformis]|uniref:F-box DNA helicase 1-like n=1 Tax=Amphiura filiformis TaxID=82378 RepID=UPI003B216F59
MSSKDEFITTMHVPTTYPKNERSGRVIADLEHHMRMKLADDATLVWGVIINVKCKETISHDVYLKLYQLEKPWLYDYDCLLIDEAQDLTPVQQDILLRQSCAKILVGDPNQQIYSFRGAENAMDQIQRHAGDNIDVKTFHLTQSFRFGPEIAYVSNLLLEFLKNNTTQFIVGTGKQGGIHGDEVGTIAIICRSNVVLFDQAVKICDDARKEKKNTRIGFAGGIKGYQLDMLLDIYRLYANEPKAKIRSKFISMRNSFGDLRSYAFNAMDGELEGKIKIVQKYNIRIPALISEMKRRTIERLEYADIILSTAHKAKGLEFDTVRLTEDFALEAFLLEANGQAECGIKPDELNLIYVAVTRAKKRLVLNYHLMKFLEYAHETFECPVSTKSVLAQHDEVPHCLECKSLIEAKTNSPLITKRPRLQISFPRPSAEMPPNDGYMCASCSAQGCPWLFELCGQEYASDEEMLLCIGEGYDPNNLEYELVDFEDSDTEEEGAKNKDDREAEEDGGENT